ncbi:P-loop containing nucleoside triphosphate hydrolase protein [Ceratobasidium sp. AG-I]|nr:P-loop containing nucleoside triphosphate hydrolase protein [Ceratobasidium sp. AG-I]
MSYSVIGTPAGNRWAVVLSNRAVKELRKLERDKGGLEIIHKKIKELSLGQFTFDNHRNLHGTSQHIPLFRARVLPNVNVRIIYQIDVLPDPAGSFDHQVIKIFGIIPRAQVDYNFWVKASARFVRANPLYKLRCTYRLPAGANDKYRPAMFPHEEYGLGISNQESGYLLNDLDTSEMEAIQEITMERFAPLNKSLYNSVAADLDMAFPMVLDEHERRIVNHTGASIVIGRSGTGKTTALIYKMRTIDQANTTQGGQQSVRQLFVTRSRVLAQHVEATYQGLVEFTNIALKTVDELKEIAKQSREDPDRALVEFDSEIDLRNDLPERFSELQDSSFPLFISFDKLCTLLEADIRSILPNQIGSLASRTLIGFDDFVHTYWPSFRGLSQSLEPNLVYSEIIGVIKGSQSALESKDGYLTRREYVETLSRRQFPLLAHVRDKVYSIFEIYTKNKMARRETDAADRRVNSSAHVYSGVFKISRMVTCRTRLILRHIHQTIGESRVDYLYIDEVQDNLMADIHLLRSLAKSAENIYWSGDSAQTVVAGSAFRINDLKAFTYRDQADASTTYTPRKTAAQFTTFELNVNFRSLSGIVRFAGYVVQAIHGLFPESLDPMEPERAKHFGDPPVLFTDVRNEAGYFEKFLLGSSASNRVVFGAQQAILVRDTAAAEELDSRLQGLCNILPVMDSKGLEFDDVLLYNFFSQSPAPASAWDYLLGNVRGNQAPPPVLCSELKLLYVAMTRARRRCWIWDSGEVISRLKPMWIAQDIIKVERSSQMIGRLATASSQSEWISKGREYFTHRLYKLAAACFRQAGRPSDARLSTAYHVMTRTKLKRLRGDNPIIRKELAAAASELEKCAETLALSQRTNVYFHAATCFENAREWVQASGAFFRAGRHGHGVKILFDARDFIHGAKALIENRPHLEPKDFEVFREQARVHFLNKHEYRPLGPLFDTVDEKITYVRQRDFKVQLRHILAQHQRFDELAEEYLHEGDLDRGVQYYIEGYQCHHTTASVVHAVELALGYIESVLLIEGVYRKTSHDLARSLVNRVQPFASQADPESCQTIDLFYAYLVYNHVNLDLLKAFDSASSDSRQPRQILACHLATKNDSWLHDDSVDVVIEHLEIWGTFVGDVLGMTKGANPSSSKSAQQLIGFSPESTTSKSSNFTVSENSFMQHHVEKSVDDDGFEITPRFVNTILREELPKRVHKLLDSLHTAALASPWVLPCHYSTSPLLPSLRRHPPDSIITSIQHSSPKLRVMCSILSVFDKSSSGFKGFSDYTIAGQSWLLKLFGIVFSTTGETQSFSVLNTVAEPVSIAKCLSSWLRRDQNQLRKAAASDISITHALIHMLVRSAIYHEFLQSLGVELTLIDSTQESLFNLEIVRPLQDFLFGRSYNRFTIATSLLGHIVNQTHRVDALAIISFIEQLTRETIVHNNESRSSRLYYVLLPFSWILPVARKYGVEGGRAGLEHIGDFLSHLEQLSVEMCFGPPGRWHIGGKNGSGPIVDLINLRLCWCVALLISNMRTYDPNMSLAIQSLKRLASDDMPTNYRHRHCTSAGLYHKFSDISSQSSTVRILSETFRHESLILVQQSLSSETHPAEISRGVHLVVCREPADLIHKLERMGQGESPDSSDEESEMGYGYGYGDHDDLDQFDHQDDEQDEPDTPESDQSEEEESDEESEEENQYDEEHYEQDYEDAQHFWH